MLDDDYIKSLRDKNDIFSGDTNLLTGKACEAFGRLEGLEEEYLSTKWMGLDHPDVVDLKHAITATRDEYEAAMRGQYPNFSDIKTRAVQAKSDIQSDTAQQQLHEPQLATASNNTANLGISNIRVAKGMDDKWVISAEIDGVRTPKREISYDDLMSHFQTKTATKEQLAEKYLASDIHEIKHILAEDKISRHGITI